MRNNLSDRSLHWRGQLSELRLDEGALRSNVAAVCATVPKGCTVCAVLKGDAYGHGLRAVAGALEEDEDVSMFAVASLDEAMTLRRQGSRKRVLILSQVLPEQLYGTWMRNESLENVILSAYSPAEVAQFASFARHVGIELEVHLRLDLFGGLRGMDSGMFRSERETMLHTDAVHVTGIYGHVYSAYGEDEVRKREDLEAYAAVFRDIPLEEREKLQCHLLTSVSFYRFPEYCFDMVRVGVALYGLPIGVGEAEPPRLRQVASLRSTVLNIVDVNGQSELDYDGNCPEGVRRVALVSVGSWDIPNFFRGARTSVVIRGRLLYVAGSPCMDTCYVDITHAPEVRVGDTAWFLGPAPGVTLYDKLRENGFGFQDCNMLFSGMGRLKKRLIHLDRK
jgi:alanine racemase